MSLKSRINRKKILNPNLSHELEIPGEPLIYSVKHRAGKRTHAVPYFRNMQWKSLLKCYFTSYYCSRTPVVILVRFYVSPPSYVKVAAEDLRRESTPAVTSFEVCDYVLSFLEMFHHVLINSYRQVVKLEVDKFYSARPRTVFKFLKWSDYVELQNNNTLHTQPESFHTPGKVRQQVQPLEPGNAKDA